MDHLGHLSGNSSSCAAAILKVCYYSIQFYLFPVLLCQLYNSNLIDEKRESADYLDLPRVLINPSEQYMVKNTHIDWIELENINTYVLSRLKQNSLKVGSRIQDI